MKLGREIQKRMPGRNARMMASVLAAAMLVTMTPFAGSAVHGADESYAPAATEAQLDQAKNEFVVNSDGGVFKIVGGEAYVWGSNSGYALGLKDTATGENILSPKLHDFFNHQNSAAGNVKKVVASAGNSIALTDQNKVYGWGTSFYYYLTTGYASDGGAAPYALDLSKVTDPVVKDIQGYGSILTLEDGAGNWYITGWKNTRAANYHMVDNPAGVDTVQFQPISSTFLQKFAGTSIKKMVPHLNGSSCYIITDDGKLYVIGQRTQLMFANRSSSSTPIDVLAEDSNLAAAMEGVDLSKALNTNGQNSTLIDKDGNVWAAGLNGSNCISSQDGTVSLGKVIFRASQYQKKAVRTYISNQQIFILCDDNTLYATGSNANQFIDVNQPADATISKPTQVVKSISVQDTIVGVYPSNYGVTVLTKSGDLYYSGDNSHGTAGNGSTESPEAGTADPVVPPDLPPVEPATENRISFELELADGRTCVMDSEQPSKIRVTSGSSVTTTDAALFTIRAGEPFKLKVYFTDFAKLSSFVVPIRFNPNVLQVVNGDGVAYDTASLVQPGKIGKAVGIESYFNSQIWNGSLAAGRYYPKISNGGGWVSVAGYTGGGNAPVTGTNAMFSIQFMALNDAPAGTAFDFATSINVPVPVTGYQGPLYDEAGNESSGTFGAGWSIAADSMEGEFTFKNDPFPKFNTKVVDMTDYSLRLSQDSSDGKGVEVATRSGVEGEGFGIDYKNTTATYTMSVMPDPEDASFPNVDWSFDLLSDGGEGGQYGAYLSVLQTKGTSLKLKVSESFPEDVSFAAIRISAKPKIDMPGSGDQTRTMVLYIQSFEPPKTVTIQDPTGTAIDAMTYHYNMVNVTKAALENKVFTANLEFKDEASKVNYGVVWKLLKKDRTELDLSSPDAPFAVDEVKAAASDVSSSSIKVRPLKTTFAEDYVILRAESAYDSKVADEAILKVQFYPSSLSFQRPLVRIPINTARDLNTLIKIEPQDVYATNLKWERISKDLEGGPYLTFNNTSNIVTRGKATTDGAYEVIRVTDQLSGETAELQIAVLALDSPLSVNSITVDNQLSEKKDSITIASGLQPDDVITLYPSYDATAAAITFPALTAEDLVSDGAYTFNLGYWLPDGLLEAEGGELGLSVTRWAGDLSAGAIKTYDRMPITYSSEPSHVYGYIRLAGKETASSRNAGIQVKLENTKHSETVTTKENGYFEFTQYIPPGNYTLTIGQNQYLKRIIESDDVTGYQGLVIPVSEEFCISSQDEPIYLYPGDLNGDGAINSKDLTGYVQNWFGLTASASSTEDFAAYDFFESTAKVINLYDLNMLLNRNGWTLSSYPNWVVPEQN